MIHAGLDQLWLMVSPGNPLKSADGMAPLPSRLASAARIADGRRIIATDIERRSGTALHRRDHGRAEAPLSGGEIRLADGGG